MGGGESGWGWNGQVSGEDETAGQHARFSRVPMLGTGWPSALARSLQSRKRAKPFWSRYLALLVCRPMPPRFQVSDVSNDSFGRFKTLLGSLATKLDIEFGLAGDELAQFVSSSRAVGDRPFGTLRDLVLPFMILRRDQTLERITGTAPGSESALPNRGSSLVLADFQSHILIWAPMPNGRYPSGAEEATRTLGVALGRRCLEDMLPSHLKRW